MICHNLRWRNEGRSESMKKMILKIFALPVYLILCLLSGLLDIGLRVYCYGAGIVYWFLFICLLLAVICKQWLNVGIFVGIIGVAMLVTFWVGIVVATIEIWKDKLKATIVA